MPWGGLGAEPGLDDEIVALALNALVEETVRQRVICASLLRLLPLKASEASENRWMDGCLCRFTANTSTVVNAILKRSKIIFLMWTGGYWN